VWVDLAISRADFERRLCGCAQTFMTANRSSVAGQEQTYKPAEAATQRMN
jgi:hypothetical protein